MLGVGGKSNSPCMLWLHNKSISCTCGRVRRGFSISGEMDPLPSTTKKKNYSISLHAIIYSISVSNTHLAIVVIIFSRKAPQQIIFAKGSQFVSKSRVTEADVPKVRGWKYFHLYCLSTRIGACHQLPCVRHRFIHRRTTVPHSSTIQKNSTTKLSTSFFSARVKVALF